MKRPSEKEEKTEAEVGKGLIAAISVIQARKIIIDNGSSECTLCTFLCGQFLNLFLQKHQKNNENVL